VSSIRLFILGSLDERGPMHGHALRLLAEEEHIDEWTDFTVGAVYGAIKRLDTEGLIEEDRVEKQGNYPERMVYRITGAGHSMLDHIRLEALTDIVIKADPFNLALARLDRDQLDDLPAILADRVARLRETARTSAEHVERIAHHLTIAEQWSLKHQAARWRSELEWHEELLAALPEIISDEKSRKDPS
jgi:DNA-binding PadR family transcriptional regulator